MDGERFDRIAVSLSAVDGSRRAALRLLAGGALGGLLGLAGRRDAAARCKLPGKPCARPRDCCIRICKQGRCRCDDGRKPCAGVCCGELEGCRDGQCVDQCQDRKRNGDESDVDCGGDRCPKCVVDRGCFFDTDCESGVCEDAKCRECRIDDHCGNVAAPHCVDLACVNCRDDDDCGDGVCVDNACRECRADTGCSSGEVCSGFRCIAPATCPAGRDLCSQGFVAGTACGASGCRCYTTEANGTLCLDAIGGVCADVACTSDAQCVGRHGPGAFCVVDSGNSCGCRHCGIRCA